MFEIRTDLAVEEKEGAPGDGGEIAGVALREWRRAASRIKLTEVRSWTRTGPGLWASRLAPISRWKPGP